MSVKSLQILLVVAAVFCAVGIAASLGGSGASMPDNFRAPGWVSALEGLAPQPTVSRRELRRGRRTFPPVLTLSGRQPLQFSVARDPDTQVRQLKFEILEGKVVIRYEPHGRRKTQSWSNDDPFKPEFIIYDTGGTLAITPKSTNVRLRVK